jgi:IS30 family transposase
LVTGESVRSIAARLGRAPSTISREIKRNGGRDGCSVERATKGTLRYRGPQQHGLYILQTTVHVHLVSR